jgi:hypothetical protein
VRADELLTAFVELESAAERPEDCGTRKLKLDELSRIELETFSITSSDVSTHLQPG